MAVKTGMFKNLRQAKATIRANYERPGHYIQLINRVKADVSRKKEGFVVIEKTIVAAVEGKHTIGETVSHMMMEKHDSFLGNIKAFLLNVLSINEDDFSDEEMEEAMEDICGEGNPLGGTFVEVENRDTTTKAGGTFTVINYKREVPASEVADLIAGGEIDAEKFYRKVMPQKELEALVANESSQEEDGK